MDNSVVYGELNLVGGMIAGMFLTNAISVQSILVNILVLLLADLSRDWLRLF
jgi:hypothetical protein